MRTTTSFSFYCRRSKMSKQNLAPLELGICINGKRLFINLPQKFSPDEFAAKRQTPVIKQSIIEWRRKIDEILVEMMQNSIPITAEHLRDYIRTGGVKSYTVDDLFTEFLGILKARVGKTLTITAYKKYEYMRSLVLKEIAPTSECNTITVSFVQNFKANLEKNYETSTCAGILTKFKAVMKFAMDNNHIQINPFQNIKIAKGQGKIDYLTVEEIDKIRSADLNNTSLERVRDFFLLQLSSGMSYTDMCDITKEDIQESNGVYYISKRRKKTNTEFTCVLLPDAVRILDKYNYQIPVISNQKTNVFLHRIEELIGLNKSLHTHLARHTYGQLLLNSGVRLETVSRALGHSSVKITESYYCKMREKEIVNEIGKIIS